METGRENAKRFVKWIEEQAQSCRVVIAYEGKWPWMSNQEWRREVIIGCQVSGDISTPKFAGPCELDDEWQFSCYSLSKEPTKRINSLSLDDHLPE